ncbi:MAG: hypothetical protein P8R42_01885 [Candidatus Binatia bacterium]|nr:hypothetical protein [Candidatus Binatia bacterium]
MANTNSPPTFSAPSAALATFEGAVVMNEFLNAGVADLVLFPLGDQALILGALETLSCDALL